MRRLKLQTLISLALGALVVPLILSHGSRSVVQAEDGAQTAKKAGSQAPADKVDQATQRAAIDKATQGFIEAFTRADVDQIAAYLSEGAELISDDAPPLRSREAIRKALVDHFAENPRKKFSREVESLRFTSQHSATEEGNLKVSVGSEAPRNMGYSLELVNEVGKWLITSIREWPSKNADLLDLEWLIGSWEAKQPDAEVRSTYEWFGSKSYIRSTMTLREKDRTLTAMQMIGVDPGTDELRILTFESDGGFAEGTCTREGNTWIFDSHGALADGSELSATNILVRVNSDTFTWQPVKMQLGDEIIDDLPPVKVTRLKTTK
jgi:hypothetical protein